jgi:uncharacterized membrane protein HdeD (DUF308 family)
LSTTIKVLVAIIAIVGVLAIVSGVVYYAEPVHSLPSFFPGHAHVGEFHRHKRGAAGIVFGVVLSVIAAVVAVAGRRTNQDLVD